MSEGLSKNQSKNKHVEILIIRRLDEGSIPSDSTLLKALTFPIALRLCCFSSFIQLLNISYLSAVNQCHVFFIVSMKNLLFSLLVLSVQFSIGQTFNDIAISQGITNVQSTPNHFANGMSFYDFNEDGWDDLTFPAHNDSIVFYENVNGDFQQIGSMLYAEGNPREIMWVDYDNDLDLDLCLTYVSIGLRIYQNDGNFNFTNVTSSIGISTVLTDPYGFSFADPDADGDLDLYLCNYSEIITNPVDFKNQFYVNQGDGTFIEMGNTVGIDNGYKTSFMGVWYDFNEDNNIDLHVINDRFPYGDALYENNGSNIFSDVSVSTGVLNNGHNPMGISISDYNNDGFQDAFISDVGTGNSVYGLELDYKLYTNQNGLNFVDFAQSHGLDTNIMGWGGLWVDYDNDGYEDLYVATSRLDPLTSLEETSLFYKNEQGASFSLINDSINADILSSAYSPVKGDINNDGFYDIVVLNGGVMSNVLQNSGNDNNFIKITPLGTISNQKAIGAKVKVFTGNLHQYQTVMCGSGICSQNSQHMIFGIGQNTLVDSVEITFPSGIVVRKYNLNAQENYTIIEKAEVFIDIIPGTSDTTLCQGDSIIIGSSQYSNFLWNTGSTDSLITVLTDGTYSFTAENLAGDTLYRSTELIVHFEQTPIYQTIVNNLECGNNDFGSATLLFISPPSSFFDISWSNGDVGITMDSVVAGTYTATIESEINCVYSEVFNIVELPEFSVQFLTSPVTNSSLGNIEFFVFGGTPPFVFEMNSVIESSYISSLTAGNYDITITDSNGCQLIIPFIINDESTIGLLDIDLSECTATSTDGFISFSCTNSIQFESFTIRSILGDIVATHSDGITQNVNHWRSLKRFSTGVYLITYELDRKHIVKRIFVN